MVGGPSTYLEVRVSRVKKSVDSVIGPPLVRYAPPVRVGGVVCVGRKRVDVRVVLVGLVGVGWVGKRRLGR